jgi:hypothetical protein
MRGRWGKSTMTPVMVERVGDDEGDDNVTYKKMKAGWVSVVRGRERRQTYFCDNKA